MGMTDKLTTYVFTTTDIVYDKQPILRVVHEEDGDWQVLGGGDCPAIEKAMLVSLGEILQIDESLLDVVPHLNRGSEAVRFSPNSQWIIKGE